VPKGQNEVTSNQMHCHQILYEGKVVELGYDFNEIGSGFMVN
jgi:hypothetical protein